MNLSTKLIQKAAEKTAAFSFLIALTFSFNSYAKVKPNIDELEAVKKKVTNLLMQKQKKQALASLDDFMQNETNRAAIKEAKSFRVQIAKMFLSKEAQESYEMSLNLTIDNPKESRKNNEDCLTREPENLDCLIQRARLIYREKKKSPLSADELEKTASYFETNEINWIKASAEKTQPEFRNYNFFKKDNSKWTEEKFVLAALEVDRSLLVKNFSKAREIIALLEKEYPDWPDLIYFKEKLDVESSENKALESTEINALYQNKCKSLSKSVIRKYRYDFELCLRGI